MHNTIHADRARHLLPKSVSSSSNTSNYLWLLLLNASRHAMPAYEQKHAMEGSEAYKEEVNRDIAVEEDVCCEETSLSCQLYDSHFPPNKERQISVDPASLKQPAKVGDRLSRSPPTLPPLGKPKFYSCSLPSSALASPESGSATTKSFKKWKIPAQHQHTAALSRLTLQQGMPLRRSKSCGEGRSCAPSDEFDIPSRRPSMNLPENGIRVLCDCTDDAGNYKDSEEVDRRVEQNFKCGALCLFLPGFSRKKRVQASQDEQGDQGSVVSRAVSLEKFECGSWSSAAILDVDDEEDGAGESYFDLPVELIRSSADDADSPVKTAFVFDRDRKGVLKKSTSNLSPGKSHEASNRHVRFSTSTPTSYPTSPSSACVTPRLRKAREEFNAFLEAQST